MVAFFLAITPMYDYPTNSTQFLEPVVDETTTHAILELLSSQKDFKQFSPYWNTTQYDLYDLNDMPSQIIQLHETVSRNMKNINISATELDSISILVCNKGSYYVHFPKQIKRYVCNVCVMKPSNVDHLFFTKDSYSNFNEGSLVIACENECFGFTQVKSDKPLVLMQMIYI
jgi:hypothetical protein